MLDAYDVAVEFLLKDAMPIIVEAEDGLHVLAVYATEQHTHDIMNSANAAERLAFVVKTMVAAKEYVDERLASNS